MTRPSLNARRVELIRTSGLTDAHWARIWRVRPSAIREARTGRTWAGHPTPPDTRPRLQKGPHSGPEARIAAVEPVTPDSISQALRAWRTPTSEAEHP